MPRNASKKDFRQFSTEVPTAMFDRLKQLAQVEGISRNEYVRKAIVFYWKSKEQDR